MVLYYPIFSFYLIIPYSTLLYYSLIPPAACCLIETQEALRGTSKAPTHVS